MEKVSFISPVAIAEATLEFIQRSSGSPRNTRMELPEFSHGTSSHPETGAEFEMRPKNLITNLRRGHYLRMDEDKNLDPFFVIVSYAVTDAIHGSPDTVYAGFDLYYDPGDSADAPHFRDHFFSIEIQGFPDGTFWTFGSFHGVREVNRDVFDFAVKPNGAISLTQVQQLAAHFKAIQYLLKSLRELLPDLPILED